MKTRTVIKRIFDEILHEVDTNPEFAKRLLAASGLESPESARRVHRRTPAKLDPIEVLLKNGETGLRTRLAALNLDELKDIVAQFAMDPAKLVMKWKDSARIVEHLVSASSQRLRKGDAFRKDSPTAESPISTSNE